MARRPFIGSLSQPRTERQSPCFDARLAERFDAAVFFGRPAAVTALAR